MEEIKNSQNFRIIVQIDLVGGQSRTFHLNYKSVIVDNKHFMKNHLEICEELWKAVKDAASRQNFFGIYDRDGFIAGVYSPNAIIGITCSDDKFA